MSELLDLDSPGALEERIVGAKAASLARLRRDGHRVPDALLVPSTLSGRLFSRSVRDQLVAAATAWGGTAIVRSSAPSEDGPIESRAGFYESRVATAAGIVDAIAEVRAHAVLRHSQTRVRTKRPIAVIVQRRAIGPGGVYLSIDPIRGAGHVLEIADAGASAVTSGNDAGTQLDANTLAQVLRVCRKIEEQRGGPVDIEIVIERGRPTIVQARPQTATGGSADGFTSELLEEHFNMPMPRLAAAIWIPLLSSGLGVEVRHRVGMLEMRGEPATPPSSISTARSAITFYDDVLRAHWRRSAARAIAASGQTSANAWRSSLNRFGAFMTEYFRNPIASWIDRARGVAQRDALSVVPASVRRRVAALERARAMIAECPEHGRFVRDGIGAFVARSSSPAASAVRRYIHLYGCFSENGADFAAPYPDDDPDLLAPVLLADRPTTNLEKGPTSTSVWTRLLEIAEDDNLPKFRHALALRRTIVAVGRSLASRGRLSAPDDVWELAPDEIEQALYGRRVVLRRAVRVEQAGVRSMPASGRPLSPGKGAGWAWCGSHPMPPAPRILVCRALGPPQVAVLKWCAGVLCTVGTTASHGAIIAHEQRVPVVAERTVTSALEPGHWVELDGTTGAIRVSKRSLGSRPAKRGSA